MKFYTNVVRYGNNLLIREVNNGERSNRKVKYSPTMYMRVGKPTSHKSLDGRFVTPVKHETMKECNEWLQSYENQKHLIFGNTLHAYSYIADTYPNTVNWDIDQILIVTISNNICIKLHNINLP